MLGCFSDDAAEDQTKWDDDDGDDKDNDEDDKDDEDDDDDVNDDNEGVRRVAGMARI